MKIDIRKYKESNLVVIDVLSDKDKLLNIIIVAYSDTKKHILLKKAVFEANSPFVDRIDYNILDICEEIVNTYGDKSDIEKLWLAERLFKNINYNE